MKALVTGSAGFVGKHLVRHLANNGDEIVESDRSAGGPDVCDREGIASLVQENPCEVVFHLAGQSHVPTSWRDPIGTLRANVEGTQNVLDAAFEAQIERVLVVTSAEVYGAVAADDLPILETHPLQPRNPYAASKVGAEAVAQYAFHGRGQAVIRVRAFNHFGPGQRTDFAASGLASRIAAAAQDGTNTVKVGNLAPRRDFTDVRDVVAAYRHLALDGRAGDAYNVCSGRDRSIREIAEGLVERSGAPLDLVPDPELERSVDIAVSRGDNRKIVADTGWTPRIDFSTSLSDIYDDAIGRLDG